MFKQVFPPSAQQVTIYFEGAPLKVDAGITVAAAVLSGGPGNGPQHNRVSPHKHEKRGAYCNMGVCFECLMEIDGKPNQQACLTVVKEGMRVNRQLGAPDFSGKDKPEAKPLG